MLTSRKPAAATAAQEIRRMLKTGGSAEHAQTAQRFFKEEIRSYGWRTGDLRRAVVHKRREILKQKRRGIPAGGPDRQIRRSRVQLVEILATPNQQLVGPRCSCALSHRSDDCHKTGSSQKRFPLGKVSGPLASEGGLRRVNSRDAAKNVFPINRKTLHPTLA